MTVRLRQLGKRIFLKHLADALQTPRGFGTGDGFSAFEARNGRVDLFDGAAAAPRDTRPPRVEEAWRKPLEEGKDLLGMGQYRAAADRLRHVVTIAPGNREAREWLNRRGSPLR